MALMSTCTFGLYELYWFYKNWVLIKERTQQSIMPFWRAFFAPIWAYSCFKHIRTSAEENAIPGTLPIGLLAITYFIVQALWRLPDPFWLVSYLSFALMLPANSVALKVNTHLVPDYENNSRFSAWNWVGLVLGGSLFVLAILGLVLPEIADY
jgi:hypothetical protein